MKKKKYKTLFIIHQCVAPDNFEKVGDVDSSNEAWDILEKIFRGVENVKEVKLQTHKRTYELLPLEESLSVANFFTRVIRLVNQIKMCGKMLTSRSIVVKILRSLLINFDHVVVTIEELKDLPSMTKEELQGTLESHE